MKILQTFLILLQLCLYLQHVLAANRDTDICVLLKDCPRAWNLSQHEIRNRICGYEDNRYPKIWCTLDCVTPDSDKGVCTPAESCGTFNDIFRNSDPNNIETAKYLRQFVCRPVSTIKKHYVCCPNKPLPGKYTTPSSVTQPNRYGTKTPATANNLQCGISADEYKVVGGSIANIGEHPWAAQLQYTSKGRTSINCGGTLINRRYVLTAAHCIDDRAGKLINVILGEHNTSSPIDCFGISCAPRPKMIKIEKIIQHPGWIYAKRPFYDDIALLRLAQDVEFSGFIQPICLVEPNYAPSYSTELIVAGWGRADNEKPSEVKRVATLFRQESSKCLSTIPIPLRQQQLCVGGGKADSCKGDSGGPLMTSVDIAGGIKVWYLVGVVSLGYDSPCGTTNKPGVYTSVSHYLSWIQKNTY